MRSRTSTEATRESACIEFPLPNSLMTSLLAQRLGLMFSRYSAPAMLRINLDPANPCVGNEPAALFTARCGSTVAAEHGWMLFGTVSSHSQTQFFDKVRGAGG